MACRCSTVTWDAPNCALPQALQGSELNRIIAKVHTSSNDPALHPDRFRMAAPRRGDSHRLAREEQLGDFETNKGRHGEPDFMPDGLDLHPDRIVLDRLAVPPVVVGSPNQGKET